MKPLKPILISQRGENMSRPKTFFSTSELAEILQVDPSTIKRWAETGKLRCFKTPGGHRRFSTSGIREFIAEYHFEVIDPRPTIVTDRDLSAFASEYRMAQQVFTLQTLQSEGSL